MSPGDLPAVDAASVPGRPAGPVPSDSSLWSRAFSALRIAGYRTLWVGQLFNTAAMQMDLVLRPWLAYHISGSGLTLGLVVFARGLPQMVLPLLAGAVVDRVEKRRLLLVTQSVMDGLAALTALLVHLQLVRVWHLIAIGVAQGAVLAINLPLRMAYISAVVGPERLGNAVALNFTALNLNSVIAPLVGGALIAWRPSVGFYTIAGLYGAAVLMLLRLPPTGSGGVRPPVWQEALAGLRYLAGHPLLRRLFGMSLIPIALGLPFQQFLPVFQADVLRVDASRLGLMFTAVGAGALTGSIVAGQVSESPRKETFQLASGIGFGASLAGFALSTAYATSLMLLFIIGLCSQIYLTINSVLIMMATDPALHGRVMSLHLIIWSLMLLAAVPTGSLVDRFGAPATIAALGTAMIVIFLSIGARRHVRRGRGRATRRAERRRDDR
jgi:MFS family permease